MAAVRPGFNAVDDAEEAGVPFQRRFEAVLHGSDGAWRDLARGKALAKGVRLQHNPGGRIEGRWRVQKVGQLKQHGRNGALIELSIQAETDVTWRAICFEETPSALVGLESAHFLMFSKSNPPARAKIELSIRDTSNRKRVLGSRSVHLDESVGPLYLHCTDLGAAGDDQTRKVRLNFFIYGSPPVTVKIVDLRHCAF